MTPMVIMLQDAAEVTQQIATQAAGEVAQKKGMFGMGGNMDMILLMVAVFAIMWLFMIRPQQKQQKELAKFRQGLEKGAKVMTAGGIHGVVKEVKDNSVVITVDKDVTLEVEKTMITRSGISVQK